MNLAIEKVGEVLVVSPEGQINSGNAAGIEADLLSHVEKGERRFVLDMSNLNYISSAGLRVVLVLAKRLKQGRARWRCARCSRTCAKCSTSAVSWPS